MKKLKKFTAVVLALATMLFSFAISGFAVYSSSEENTVSFDKIRIFEGKFVVYYSKDGFLEDECTFRVEDVGSGEILISIAEDNYDYTDNGEKLIFQIDNEAFDKNAVCRITVKLHGEKLLERQFNVSDVIAAVPEFERTNNCIEEYEKYDLSDEILIPVGYDKELYLNGYDIYNDKENECAVKIDGMTVEARNTGRGNLKLMDSDNNVVAEMEIYIREYNPTSFSDALIGSFKKFFDSAGESTGNFLMMGLWIGEGIIAPFVILLHIITLPIQMLLGIV